MACAVYNGVMRKKLLILGAIFLIAAPFIVLSAGLVPCGTSENPTPCSLCYLFLLGTTITTFLTTKIAPALAVLAFALAGFKILISGGSPGTRQEGIKIIRNTIIGLLIVFSAWIVINELLLFFAGNIYNTASTTGGLQLPWHTINCSAPVEVPASGTTTIPTSETTSPTATTLYGTQTAFTAAHNAAYNQLRAYNSITIYGSGGLCMTPQQAYIGKCTAVAYLPQSAINGIKALVQNCNCSITITGGTEKLTHTTHGPNIPIVDLNYVGQTKLNTYITTTGVKSVDSNNCSQYTINGARYIYENSSCMGAGTPQHWHVIY